MAVEAYPDEVKQLAIELVVENQGDQKAAYDLLGIALVEEDEDARVPHKATFKKWILASEDAFPMVGVSQKRGLGQMLFFATQKFTKHIADNMEEIPESRWPQMLDYLVKAYLDVTEGRAKNGATTNNNLVTLNFGDPRRYMEFVNKVEAGLAEGTTFEGELA